MKKTLLFIFLAFSCCVVYAQKQLTIGDCTINYAVSGGDANTGKNLSSISKTLYIKGKMTRVDISSSNFTQSTIYDSKTGTAVVLKEVGTVKYISTFPDDKW